VAKRKLTAPVACAILVGIGGRGSDFHELSSSKVDELLKAAAHYGYRKPKNANGSRGRYFFARLQRLCK
jgi:hypothetical protein